MYLYQAGHQRSDMRLNTSMICCRIVHFHWFCFIFFSSFLCLLRNHQFQLRIKKHFHFFPQPLFFSSSFPLLFHTTKYTFWSSPLSIHSYSLLLSLFCPHFYFLFSFFNLTLEFSFIFYFLLCRVFPLPHLFTPKVLPRAGVLGPLIIITSTLHYRHLRLFFFFFF